MKGKNSRGIVVVDLWQKFSTDAVDNFVDEVSERASEP
jgi:hypothetical protein